MPAMRTPPPSPPHHHTKLDAGSVGDVDDADRPQFKFSPCGSTREIHVTPCNVQAVGLREFVPRIMRQLSLAMGPAVEFDMNSNALIGSWDDVFVAERCYTTVLGISRREYRCFSFTHEPARRLCYLILEEKNYRAISWLQPFHFKAMVICWYDASKTVTNVQVQYDQLGFVMHCLGVHALHAALMRNLTTPLAIKWARAYMASGVVHPITFALQVALFTLCFLRLFVTAHVAQCCLSCSG
jgi:hypothetical protein